VDSEQTARHIREVEAESVALICCETLGLEGSDFCRGYVQHWLKAEKEIPNQSAAHIFAAATSILKREPPQREASRLPVLRSLATGPRDRLYTATFRLCFVLTCQPRKDIIGGMARSTPSSRPRPYRVLRQKGGPLPAHELGHLLLHDQEQLHIDHAFRVRLRDDLASASSATRSSATRHDGSLVQEHTRKWLAAPDP